MKKPRPLNSASEGSPAGDAGGDATGSEPAAPKEGGLNWLRHSGIGPRRAGAPGGKTTNGKVSGEAVTSLGSTEAEVMGLLWEIGRPATAMEVAEECLYRRRARGEQPLSFASVTTTLRRLADKGVLESHKGEGRTPFYAPTVGREEMAARILNNVSQTLLGRSLHGLIPKLVGNLKRPERGEAASEGEELERLMRALAEAAGEAEEPAS